jgi:deoxyribodipyrimidine photo-lyase
VTSRLSTGVVWFRRDLRLGDNPAFAAATAAHDEVVCLYVLDPVLLDHAGPHRRRQLLANLRALDESIRARGGCLRVRSGDPASAVATDAAGAEAVYWNDDVTPFATRRDALVREALDVPIHTWWGHLVLAPGSVLTGGGTVSKVFTPFHRAWSAHPWDPWPRPGAARLVGEPAEAFPPPDGPPPIEPGEVAAGARLAAFGDRVERYLDERDRMDLDATSGLSVDLRFGTISARHVAEVVGTATRARAGFVRQLAWRDWWAHLLAEHPQMVTSAQRPEYDGIRWASGREADRSFEAWCEGRTGFPVVDAAMRQLRRTGSMHNRARMIAGSFLVKDLLVDWRRGERWFRHRLTDGDVPQNVGNWQWVAGTGPDAAPYFRIFNPVAQSRRFDPSGAYVRTWVPELAGLGARSIHAPWEAAPLELAAAGVVLGDTYPEPIVDHGEARLRTLAAYEAARSARGSVGGTTGHPSGGES